MAVTPRGILGTFKELTPAELEQVDKLEALADTYLNQNWYDEGVCIWSAPEVISLNQLREFCKRYRDAGWHVSVAQDELSLCCVFRKGSEPSGVQQMTRGKAN